MFINQCNSDYFNKFLIMETLMVNTINSIAVLGAGTMGAGIAALAAESNCKVLLLDINIETAEKGKLLIVSEKKPLINDIKKASNIRIGSFKNDFKLIKDYDWICEVVVEKLDIKRQIFKKIDMYRNKDSIVSSNTSGIPLKDIAKGMSKSLQENVCITHFFNPVKIMKLCELIPGVNTTDTVTKRLKTYLENKMNKGVVNAKDTVNFIGNRIGCYMMLKGLHEGRNTKYSDLSIEDIDLIMSKPIGLPPTGLYGLIDLIGLDVMYSVGQNLSINLPKKDIGLAFVKLPKEEKEMFDKGQFGRKSGGGFYRIKKLENGEKIKEVFEPTNSIWRKFKKSTISADVNIILEDTLQGQFAWDVMGSTLLYASSLIPQIADDIVNIDRAMKWGFAWNKGPFEILDELGPQKFIDKCLSKNLEIPKMLKVLKNSGLDYFYNNKGKYMTSEGSYTEIID